MRFYVFLILIIFLLPNLGYAASEYATFDEFYKGSSSVSWIFAAGAALVLGAAVFLTGGAASPLVAGIGSWIGGLMGLSGAAATNAGLALLGGGSIASGGFGIIGGVTLLTTALTFGTEVVVDYSLNRIVSAYEYGDLVEKSKDMTTLPLPRNDSGPDAYENAVEILGNIDESSMISSNENQQLISQAIAALSVEQESNDLEESAKNVSLLSLLNFLSNDYRTAKKSASLSIEAARELEVRRTLPAFIFATSSLYESEFDFFQITNDYFRYSILAEPDNELIPLLFTIYLDRMMLRFSDRTLTEDSFREIYAIMQSEELEDIRTLNYTMLLSRYFIRLKLEQQKIRSLANSSNNTIKDSPLTLEAVRESLTQYEALIDGSSDLMLGLISLEIEEDGRAKLVEFHQLWFSYVKERLNLLSEVQTLEAYHQSLASGLSDVKTEALAAENYRDENWLFIIVAIFLAFFTLAVAVKRSR